jgi:peptide/nickel transport system substrate-binding protein
MKRRNAIAVVAVGAAASLALAACSKASTPSSGGSTNTGGGTVAYNSALTAVVNPSTKTGGTLKFVHPDDWDSTDPGNTYYAFSWNFSRFYARPLMTFQPAPGKEGLNLVPDLATAPGEVSADGLTWTYHIRPGAKFEDGSAITSKDVKYAVERSNYAPDVLSLGPTYFKQYLTDSKWPGPYKDPSNDKLNFKGIDTPDDTTVVFHLQQKFAEFDYLVSNPQTAPVPRAKDTGAKYLLHPVSSGPYMFEKYDVGKSLTLVKNTNWSADSDPIRKQLVDRIEVAIKVSADDRDNRLINNQVDIDAAGTGVEPAAQAKILGSDKLKKNADNPQTGFLRYVGINTQVKPFDNVHCRMAILYAADHEALQSAYGGPTSGDIATTAIPPTDTGYVKADTYNFLQDKNGNVDKAKAELQACGQPSGFTTNIIARSNRPKEVAGATALQQALTKIGVKTDIQTFPSGQYTGNYAGAPAYLHSHDVGLIFYGWGADWPSGFGFLQQISDSRAIKAAGNSNIYELNDKVVDDLLDKAAQNPDKATREGFYTQIDQEIMKQAVMLPIIYEKTLMYRNPEVSNVFVTQAFGMYDYVAMGINK